ncbi:MAG: hypothetical protein MUE65_05850, partial [Methanomassiliicoccales archaeon]|nr:hypothetical protein [Methanomassiliicoccales archaeon]
MRGAVRGLLIFNYVWLLLVFLLLVFAAIPAIPGAIIVKTPGAEGWKTTVTNDTVIMTGNVSIHNGGFFPFNNFYFVIKLYDENGSDLAS